MKVSRFQIESFKCPLCNEKMDSAISSWITRINWICQRTSHRLRERQIALWHFCKLLLSFVMSKKINCTRRNGNAFMEAETREDQPIKVSSLDYGKFIMNNGLQLRECEHKVIINCVNNFPKTLGKMIEAFIAYRLKSFLYPLKQRKGIKDLPWPWL